MGVSASIRIEYSIEEKSTTLFTLSEMSILVLKGEGRYIRMRRVVRVFETLFHQDQFLSITQNPFSEDYFSTKRNEGGYLA
jgi:hypothetical protein